jgi:hypothetical protein
MFIVHSMWMNVPTTKLVVQDIEKIVVKSPKNQTKAVRSISLES